MTISENSDCLTPYGVSGIDEFGNFSVILESQPSSETCDQSLLSYVCKVAHVTMYYTALLCMLLHLCNVAHVIVCYTVLLCMQRTYVCTRMYYVLYCAAVYTTVFM